MKLEIETIKALEEGKTYWLQVNCEGLLDSKANEKIQATMEAIKKDSVSGIKFIVTDEGGVIRGPLPLQEDSGIPLIGKYKDKTYIRTVIK